MKKEKKEKQREATVKKGRTVKENEQDGRNETKNNGKKEESGFVVHFQRVFVCLSVIAATK